MAVSAYDDAFLTDDQKRQIEKFQALYQDAYARGDHAGVDSTHAAAAQSEAAEHQTADRQLNELKIRYQDEITQAVADGAFKRAEALLQEYRKAAQSAVSTAQAQADLDMKATK